MGQVISAGILLVVVVAIYIAVSYKHEKSGLGTVSYTHLTLPTNSRV